MTIRQTQRPGVKRTSELDAVNEISNLMRGVSYPKTDSSESYMVKRLDKNLDLLMKNYEKLDSPALVARQKQINRYMDRYAPLLEENPLLSDRYTIASSNLDGLIRNKQIEENKTTATGLQTARTNRGKYYKESLNNILGKNNENLTKLNKLEDIEKYIEIPLNEINLKAADLETIERINSSKTMIGLQKEKIASYDTDKQTLQTMRNEFLPKLEDFHLNQGTYSTADLKSLAGDINKTLVDYTEIANRLETDHAGRASKDDLLKNNLNMMDQAIKLWVKEISTGDKRMSFEDSEALLAAVKSGDAKQVEAIIQGNVTGEELTIKNTYDKIDDGRKKLDNLKVDFEKNFPVNPEDYSGDMQGLTAAIENFYFKSGGATQYIKDYWNEDKKIKTARKNIRDNATVYQQVSGVNPLIGTDIDAHAGRVRPVKTIDNIRSATNTFFENAATQYAVLSNNKADIEFFRGLKGLSVPEIHEKFQEKINIAERADENSPFAKTLKTKYADFKNIIQEVISGDASSKAQGYTGFEDFYENKYKNFEKVN